MRGALFYPSELRVPEVALLLAVHATGTPTPVDVIALPEGGGSVDRELAVPHLAGMDGVVVDAARLVLRGREVEAPTTQWSHTKRSEGHLLALERPGRLLAIVVDAPDPATLKPPPPPGEEDTVHIVLRPATPDGASWSVGPPAFAHPAFAVGNGDMFDPALAGLRCIEESGGRLRLAVPPTQGQAWVVAWARGTNPAELITLDADTTIRSVTVAPSPEDVALVLRADATLPGPAGGEVLLWRHPGPVLPAEGAIEIDLTPMARKRLNDRLVSARSEAHPPPTLALPLRFTAATAGELAVEERALQVSYTASAIGAAPHRTTLAGDWTPVDLRAPARIRPREGSWSIAARHLGRELNGPLAAGPDAPTAGLLVTADRWAAVAVEVAPGPAGPGAHVDLVGLRARLGAAMPAEVVLELRADVAERPGSLVGAPAVRRLQPGVDGVVDLVLRSPARVAAGRRLWVIARANQGEVRWWGEARGGAGAVRTSVDQGCTWSLAAPRLGPLHPPAVRLFHAVDRPGPPDLRMRAGPTELAPVRLVAAGDDPLELVATGPLPAPLLDHLGQQPGDGTVTTTVHLATRAVLDLTLHTVTLGYDAG